MGLFDTAKSLGEIAQKLGDLDLRQKLLDVQSEALDLMAQLKEKDERIELLEKALVLKGKMITKDSAYYIAEEDGKITDGPFCTKCFDVDHLKCRLVADNKEPQIICPNCKVSFSSKPVYDFLRPDVEVSRKKLLENIRNKKAKRRF